jgi:hypothetical protein
VATGDETEGEQETRIRRKTEIKTMLRMQNFLCRLTVCVTGWRVGGDNAGEQKKLKAKKMFVKRAESQPSGARFVGQFLDLRTAFLYGRETPDPTMSGGSGLVCLN